MCLVPGFSPHPERLGKPSGSVKLPCETNGIGIDIGFVFLCCGVGNDGLHLQHYPG